MTVRTYSSPKAFKEALEHRLRSASKNGADFARRRQLLVFDRFLARVIAVLRDAVLLKGGLVLELRLERARTTKDIDLRLTGSPKTVLTDLQEAGRQVLGDFMAFEVSRDTEQPKIQNDGMKYEGLRFRAECRLAGKLYGQAFGVESPPDQPLGRRIPRNEDTKRR
jgi:Nucleotidyl transferase AbiEii toxin, Type IV TA system